jgi:hypothetical protein
MANLETVLNETETELIAIIKSAWGVSKVHTQPKEVEPTLAGLDEAYLLCSEVVADEDEEGTICSESGRIKWSMLLHAAKPTSGSVVRNKRAAAQALQSAIKAGTFEHTRLMRYESTAFDVLESDVQVAQGAYLIRVDFSAFVEWQD